jgi:2-polyprenyl-6-methoxyphenol hydroxylase-like FAD-dependent oxidoreductase
MDAAALEARVAAAGGATLGRLQLISAIGKFPLRLIRVADPVKPGVALVGDAAHAVHPLAGQGVNLGFGDAAALADTLAARERFRDCGELAVLRRYARSRAEAILAMRTVTDGLVRLFGARSPAAAELRNRGLNLTDRLPVLKNLLVRHALG